IRVFAAEQSLQAVPLVVIPIDEAGSATWEPGADSVAGSSRDLKYVLRAYDGKGHFDETEAASLWLYRDAASGGDHPADTATSALPAAYGESDLAHQQIPIGGGTVKVQGSGVPAGHTVWVAGRQVPVDPS